MNRAERLLAKTAAADLPQLDPWKLRCWRELRNLSQHDLADALGWGRNGNQIVCRIENWVIPVGARRLAAFADALRCRESDLTSQAAELRASRARFDAWCAAKRPELRTWVCLKQGGSLTQ